MGSDPEHNLSGPDPNRLPVIDILRGMALFGILAANMRGFTLPASRYFNTVFAWTAPSDRLVQMFVDAFIQGKFITIFAFLFGVGFASQLSRAEARGANFGRFYVRRMLLLALIGLVHGLVIWYGDILLVYALLGLVLLLFRKRKDRTLLIWVMLGFLVLPALMTTAVTISLVSGEPIPTPPPAPAEEQKVAAIYANGSFAEVQKQIRTEALRWNWGYFPVYGLQVLALFLLGVLAWRRGFFQPSAEALRRYRVLMWLALFVGISCNVAAVAIRYTQHLNAYDIVPLSAVVLWLQTVGVPALSLGYMLAVIVGSSRSTRFALFGAVGRMALSNYLLQSIIGTLIFYSYGLGMFGRVGAAKLFLWTIVIFAAQVLLSWWWMSRFRFGPVEWLWRSLTYGKRQPFLRRAEPSKALATDS
jgi:uncharacterized protein